MRIGIGLPNAIPGRVAREVRQWAEEAEARGFHSLGSIDRLVYDVLDPLVSLGVAAAVTERVELFTTVLNVGWRNNPVLLAKQLATVDLISGGRVTAGLGTGAWPDDFEASGVSAKGHGKLFDDIVITMRKVWDGEVKGVGGPTPLPGPGRPRLLLGGLTPRAYARAVRFGAGWVAPLLNGELLAKGVAGVRQEWADRPGKPQIVVGRYFSLGPDAVRIASEYAAHYYGAEWSTQVTADSIDSDEKLLTELTLLAEAGPMMSCCIRAPARSTRFVCWLRRWGGSVPNAVRRSSSRHGSLDRVRPVDAFDPESAGGRIYRALVTRPGCTTRDLAQLTGQAIGDVRRELAELCRARMVVQLDVETWDAERPDVVASASLRDHDARRLRLRQAEDELMELFRYARERSVTGVDVEMLEGRAATFLRFKKMQEEAHNQVRAIDRPPYYWDEEELARQERLQSAQMAAGIVYRTIYQESERDSPVRSASMMRSVGVGEQARVLAEPPVKLTIVDDTPALLALDPPAGAEGSLLTLAVYSPGIVNALSSIFESLWRLAVPANLAGSGDSLSSLDREILTLMASGATDEAISRRLQLSRRTVGRHTSGLLERLGASTRFQAGVQAARRGWL